MMDKGLLKIKRWNKFHALLLILAGGVSLFYHNLLPLTTVASLSFSYYILSHLSLLRSFSPFGGYANWITLFRLAVILSLGFCWPMFSYVQLFIPIVIVATLDGFDGYLARKYEQSSDFGAYLDMESDTFYVCLLSFAYYLDGKLGFWILGIGLMRYLYVGLIYLFRLEGKKEKSTRFAKTIAVALFIALMFPLLFPYWLYFPVVLLCSLAIVYSFGVSFLSLLKA
jgi:phosphatidylglycerophosphate synthase